VFYGLGALAYSELDDRWAGAVHRGLTAARVFVRSEEAPEARRLTFGDVLDIYPRFVPGTNDLAFVSPREGNNWDLYRVPFDGAGTVAPMLDRPGDIRFPRFTADGRWVVFCETDHIGQRDVVAHRFEPDSVTMVLVGTNAQECDPDVSPDGRWLAYTSDETGSTEVYVRPFREQSDARWQVSRDGGTSPLWGSTGRELFYLNARNELVAVPVLEESSLPFGSSHVLFPLDDRSVWTRETASGDQEFILIRTQPEAPGQVVLIRNFFELLKEKVG
jgi:Tol biopolymer transport system component